MNINPILKTALEPLGLPVRQSVYIPGPPDSPMPTRYIVFFTYYDGLSDFASKDAIREDLSGQVSIYSKNDYKELSEQALSLLRGAGFKAQFGRENYENDTGYYHQAIEWQWYENLYGGGAQ